MTERGGRRAGAGRPLKSTPRQSVTFRLPIHLLTQLTNRAELEGGSLTETLERALEAYFRKRPLPRA